MNTNSKNRAKNRSALGSHPNTSLQNMNRNDSKSQLKQKSSNDRPVTPEGVYFNARLMHCTTSLVGCVVQIQTKDGTQYEGVLSTFSPDFELVVDYVTKIESNYAPIVGSNITNLLLSLQSNNSVSPRVIFKFQDVVKLNAINIDLEFAANKGHLLTDSEISRLDSKQSNRDKDVKELVPWDGGHGDCNDSFDSLSLEEHNGVGTQNGWSPDEMFKVNESKFKVKSTYDPSLPDYTCPLVKGEGPDFEEKQKTALELAQQIESDPSRIERYAREDADDEDKYSAVVRPNDDDKYGSNVRPNEEDKYNTGGRHSEHLRRNKKQNSNNYPLNNNSTGSGSGPPPRQQRLGLSSNSTSTAPPFHSSKNSNNYKQFSGGNTGTSYQSQGQSSHKTSNFRDETISTFPVTGQTYTKSGENDESSHLSAGPQRSVNESRRSGPINKRKEEMTDLKKFSNDFKLPSNVDTPKDKDYVCHKSESQLKHNTSGFSAKSKSPVGAGDPIPVKDKSGDSVVPSVEDSIAEKELREVRDSSDQRDSNETLDSTSANSPIVSAPDTEIAKKSTLNPNAKTFTPRSPMTPLTTSATPPSVASTPSSTVSVPSGQTHSGPHSLSQGHSQQTQVGPSQSASHAPQARFPNPLVQIPHQYNVLTPGLGPLLAHNQYLMTNVAAMAPQFAQSNPNQQRNYRNKGPQQYTHGVRHEFTQQSAHVAAAVTGHPVLAAAPIGAPQTVSYGPQQTTTMVAPQGPPQHMYQHMYQFQPRMNVLPQHSAAMQMAVPQAVQYDPTQLQHIYTTGTVNAVQLQHLVSQAHQHMTNSGPHSGHSTPQSATPTTPLHGGPAPSPVHHQPNQPPTPTPQQSVMYANVTSAHNPQNANVGHHTGAGGPYHNIVILPSGQAMSGHHSGGHGGPLHAAAHALSHNSTANHSGGPALVHLIAGSNAQNALAASFNTSSGV